jgi:hypothetical protein
MRDRQMHRTLVIPPGRRLSRRVTPWPNYRTALAQTVIQARRNAVRSRARAIPRKTRRRIDGGVLRDTGVDLSGLAAMAAGTEENTYFATSFAAP